MTIYNTKKHETLDTEISYLDMLIKVIITVQKMSNELKDFKQDIKKMLDYLLNQNYTTEKNLTICKERWK